MNSPSTELTDHKIIYPGIYSAQLRIPYEQKQTLLDAIMDAASKGALAEVGKGGKKVYDVEIWEMPEFKLIAHAALQLFQQNYGTHPVQVSQIWANVMRNGDWSEWHVHGSMTAAVVYSMTLGDMNSGGRFGLIDRDLPVCCDDARYTPRDPHSPSLSLEPRLQDDSLVIFPAHLGHYVTCYRGPAEQARVTIAINLKSPSISPRQLLWQEFEKYRSYFEEGKLGQVTPFNRGD